MIKGICSVSEISIIEELFFSYDYMFMPWIWRAFEGSWSLKGFVTNLVSMIMKSRSNFILLFILTKIASFFAYKDE